MLRYSLQLGCGFRLRRAHGCFRTIPMRPGFVSISRSLNTVQDVEQSESDPNLSIASSGVHPHPEYCDPDADIIFQSSDGMHFKVHSPIIRLASDDFARVLNVSGASSPNSAQQAAVKLKEDQAIVKALLDSIYPRRSLPKLHPFSFVRRLASAAGKYDILDATHRIRASISRELPASSGTSLQHYALANGQGWESDARYASRFVPPPNPENPVEKPTLESMDTNSLLKLMDLHRRRHDMAVKAMTISYDKNAAKQTRQDHLRWEVIAKGHGGNCVSTAYDKAAWATFQLHLLTEVDKLSPDEFELRLKNGFWDGGELKALWDTKCTKCSKPFFTKGHIVQEFQLIAKRFPMEVD